MKPRTSYRIERRSKKGLFFICNKCEHEIELAQLESDDGSVRTRAATAMQKHIDDAHSGIVVRADQRFGIK